MSKKLIINILKNLVFLSIGVLLIKMLYKHYSIKDIIRLVKEFSIWSIILSILFSILSNLSRALRWNQLLDTIDARVNTFKVFLSIQIMYLANIFVPRAGEVARCGILSKYEKVSFTKVVGTVIIERTADAIALFIIAIGALLTQIGTIKQFFKENPQYQEKVQKLLSLKNILLLTGIIAFIIVVLFIFRHKIKPTKFYTKLVEIYHNILEGVKAILRLKRPLLFIAHTVFIYIMWLLMLYVFYLGFGATKDLGIFSAITVFVMSGLAMIIPVQAGIGTYHAAIASTLLLYNVPFEVGRDFALVVHGVTNIYLALSGLISFGIIFFFNRNKKKTGLS